MNLFLYKNITNPIYEASDTNAKKILDFVLDKSKITPYNILVSYMKINNYDIGYKNINLTITPNTIIPLKLYDYYIINSVTNNLKKPHTIKTNIEDYLIKSLSQIVWEYYVPTPILEITSKNNKYKLLTLKINNIKQVLIPTCLIFDSQNLQIKTQLFKHHDFIVNVKVICLSRKFLKQKLNQIHYLKHFPYIYALINDSWGIMRSRE